MKWNEGARMHPKEIDDIHTYTLLTYAAISCLRYGRGENAEERQICRTLWNAFSFSLTCSWSEKLINISPFRLTPLHPPAIRYISSAHTHPHFWCSHTCSGYQIVLYENWASHRTSPHFRSTPAQPCNPILHLIRLAQKYVEGGVGADNGLHTIHTHMDNFSIHHSPPASPSSHIFLSLNKFSF